MTTNNKASLALILGSLAGLATMAMHPTGSEVAASVAGGGHGSLNKFAHSIPLVAQPLLLMGTLVLTLRLSAARDLAIAAFFFYAWASVAIMIAATASGFIATAVLETGAGHHGITPDAVSSTLHYTALINRSFVKLFVAFSSLAILLWSLAFMRESGFPRLLAGYGTLCGAGLLIATVTGNLGFSIHGFGLLVLAQAIWLIWVALVLRRS